ncbi:MAG: hypothetical protein NVSMB63_18420 [Sediminibacterium sp.]
MKDYQKKTEIRWSDLDPNFHLRHSVYYDWGAFVRMSYLTDNGLTPALMQQSHIGPILFREECIFKREIRFADSISVNIQLVKSRKDLSRWSIQHEIWKNGDTLSALLTVEGAWMDTQLRKLAVPPANFREVFENMPRATGFEWMPD